MYLPLTGQKRLVEREKGKNMKVGSVSPASSGMIRPAAVGQGQSVGTNGAQGQEQNKAAGKNAEEKNTSISSDSQDKFYQPAQMSSQDFLSLHNDAASNMLETVKDIAALQVLEKTLEALGKIMED